MKITGTIIGGEKVAFKLSHMNERMKKELKIGMQRITTQLAAYVKDNKLSGQVLKRRTGTLSRSIKASVQATNTEVTGIVDSRDKGNAPLSYAHYQEYGFQGTENVKQHLRRMNNGSTATVRAHTRSVNHPARSFLRSSLAENQEMIARELNAAVGKAAHE
jgi:hypothetical protein